LPGQKGQTGSIPLAISGLFARLGDEITHFLLRGFCKN
jgi:hypothetical protein